MPKASNNLNQQYLDVADAVIVAIDAEGRVSLINKKGCQILGRDGKEIVGKDWFQNFIPKRLRRRIKSTFKKVLSGEGKAVEFFENPVLDANGEERIIAWHNTVLTDGSGQITGTLSSGEDITERKKNEELLKRSEAELRAILDTVVDGIITIDGRGMIQSFNPAASKIFGYSAEEMLGQNVNMLMPEPDHGRHDSYLSNYQRTGEKQIVGIGREVTGRRKDGTLFPLYLAVSDVQLDQETRYAGIIRDLTDYKTMQEEILQSQSLAAIGEMVASITHEIRNPLAGISGAIEVLRDGLEHDDPKRKIMDQVVEQIDRLNNTVRQLLTLSRPWSPKKQPCELGSLLDRVVLSARKQKEYAGVPLRWKRKIPVEAPVDPGLFERVVWNLLDNAVQAMPDGGEICYGMCERPGFVELTVEDTGQGVPPEIQKNLFQPFFSTKTRGIGLGLAICKKIMEAHGGSIEVASPKAGGTKVTLRFPK